MSSRLVGRSDWTPEQAARYEVALCKGLSKDKKAQRVYLQKVRVVEAARARSAKLAAPSGNSGADNNLHQSAGRAGASARGPTGQPPSDAAAKPRKRRPKTAAQLRKSVEKLQHTWLQRRCTAAANKAGGSPPKVLARVLACCGRFLELLYPEGAERMKRLRERQQVEQPSPVCEQDAADAGLGAMQVALAKVNAASAGDMTAKPTAWSAVADGSPRDAALRLMAVTEAQQSDWPELGKSLGTVSAPALGGAKAQKKLTLAATR